MNPLLVETETKRVSVRADKFQQRLCHTLTAHDAGTTDRQLHYEENLGFPGQTLQLALLERGSHTAVTHGGSEHKQMLLVITMGRMISEETKGVQQRLES